MTDNENDDFFEEDEPLEDIVAAFEGGEKGVTGPAMPWSYRFVETANRGPTGIQPRLEIPVLGSGQVSNWITGEEDIPNTRLVAAG
jgi:hypothetical protein